jgi:DNA-binding GntR family transcriptional regulator
VNDVRKEAKRLSYLSYNNIIDPQRPLELHYQSVVQEHDQIIEGLILKDEAGLKQLLQNHIETFRQRIIKFMTF